MTTTTHLSSAQVKTLDTLIAKGGEMNGYAGQSGFYCNSLPILIRKGLVEALDMCGQCAANDHRDSAICERPLPGQKGGQRCYNRVRVTDAGRHAMVTDH